MRLPPGPSTPALAQTLRWVARPVPFMEECRDRYGDPFTFKLVQIGTFVVISDPAEIKRVFTGDPDTLHAGQAARSFEPVFGSRSLFLLDGREHLRQRKLLSPPFHGERIAGYEATIREVTEQAVGRWPARSPFALQPLMQEITLEIILRVVFGIDDAARRRQVGDALVALIDAALSPSAMLPFLRRDLGPGSPWRRFVRARAASDALLYEEIARRREDPGLEEREDILSMMLLARHEDGESMTGVEVRDELMTLLLAGHETTATTLAWTFERLFRAPAAYERLREEVHARADDAYTDAVVKETLRLRPVVPVVARMLQKPWELGQWTIPAGIGIAVSIYLTHMRPEIYPEPKCFRPERFDDSPPETYSWLPFGGGVRRCIGAAFAQLEMRVVLSTLLEHVDLRPAGSWEPTKRRAVVLAPRHGTRAVMEPVAA